MFGGFFKLLLFAASFISASSLLNYSDIFPAAHLQRVPRLDLIPENSIITDTSKG
jgi:hypothetical protein